MLMIVAFICCNNLNLQVYFIQSILVSEPSSVLLDPFDEHNMWDISYEIFIYFAFIIVTCNLCNTHIKD